MQLQVPVVGMTCAACAARIQKVLQGLDGVRGAVVDFATEQATVDYDTGRVDPGAIAAAIGRAGFKVPPSTTRLHIQGMSCASCAGRVERALHATAGVLSAQVDLASELATVAQLGEPDLIAAIQQAGYSARRAPSDAEEEAREAKAEATRQRKEAGLLILCAGLTLPLVLPMLPGIPMLPGEPQLALAAPVQVLAGWRFYRGAWGALRHGTANMDVLVALGTTAAFAMSTVLLFAGNEHLYFEASAAVLTLVLLGKHLETRAKRATTQALRALTALRPDTARLEREEGIVEVPAETVAAGQVVQVRPGERLPVDGLVFEGHSEVDESLLTGESMPVEKKPGDPVTGGSINGSGLLRVRATDVGRDAALSRIIHLVQQAQARKPAIQATVDRVAAVFVPVVLIIATLTLLAWLLLAPWQDALLHTVAVLVIACPCALGLATPAALVTGTGAAARAGILIRDADVMERAQGTQVVVLDKTGTLTEGRPQLQEIEGPEPMLRLVAAAQQGSEHPLASAVLRAWEGPLPPVEEFTALVGRGLRARVEGRAVLVGNARLMREEGLKPFEEAWPGLTVVHVAIDGELVGRLGIGDRLRSEAAAAVEALTKRGIETVLLTGDNATAADFAAKQAGIERVFAEVLPAEKAAVIEALRSEGKVVAMVGDGVNDAPALAVADVGIAMAGGTDVARYTADLTLVRENLILIPAALDIAAATRRTIRQNLFWAFIYNTVGIPLAIAGLLSPVVAGAAMALSSLSVVTNALRLKRWQAPVNPEVVAGPKSV